MNTVVIGLGSNIDPHRNIHKARAILSQRFHILAASSFVKTKPVGFADQADFINGAVLIETYLDCHQLRAMVKAIELEMGRVKTANKFGPRVIDLDILVFNREIVDPDCYQRDFLKKSVLELMPDMMIQ